jgi:hypothetical protein
VPHLRARHLRAQGVELRLRNPPSLLEQAPRPHAEGRGQGEPVSRLPDLGDFVVALLAGTLAGLADRLVHDGFEDAAGLVADLVDIADDFLSDLVARPPDGGRACSENSDSRR